VALHRTRKAGRYEPADVRQFAVLHAHLERALAIASRLGTLGTKEQVNTEWFDRNAAAVLFLNEARRVVFCNRAAQKIQEEHDGIHLGSEGVRLSHLRCNAQLQVLIGQALSPAAIPASSGGAMRVPRPSGKRPYGIHVSPVARGYTELSGFRPAVCVVISDPEQSAVLPQRQLAAAFGLTGAEAKLAAQLANGEDLRAAAENLRISYATARARLAEVFQKTSTRRQAELVRLILTTFPPLRS
jgi:DNA-binding CsgD family transcriptional regulator